MRLAALLSVVLCAGCADVCTRAAQQSTTFPERHAACFAQDTLPSPTFDAKACKASMSACTSDDQRALHAYFDCLELLPVCTEATKNDFNAKVLACAKGMMTLSEGCFRP